MDGFIFDISVIIAFSAVLAVIAFFLRQPIIIAYIACGMIAGPWGIGFVKNAESIEVISHIGITLLLFLAGLCLHPQRLFALFKKTIPVTLVNCVASFIIVFALTQFFDFSLTDSIIVGLALMFSSTILLIKLIPTTALHHERMGATCIAILILQDIIAVLILALIRSMGALDSVQAIAINFVLLLVKLCAFIGVLVLIEHFVLRKIISKIDRLHELIFIIGLAWCFGLAGISNKMGMFYETGAFFAGVVLARHPIALFLSENLKPLRDFFLVLFFFTLGAQFNFLVMRGILVPAVVIAVVLLVIKPIVFRALFIVTGENKVFSKEAGIRLGQLSEFSLLIAFLAFELGQISDEASQLIQLTTIITIVVSSYVVVFKYPTPIGIKDSMIRD